MPIREFYLYTVRAEVAHYGTINFKVVAEDRAKAEEYLLAYCKDNFKSPSIGDDAPCEVQVHGVMRTDTEVVINSAV